MPESPGAPKTFLIADVRGFTLFTAERGDEAAAALVESFARLTDKIVAAADGSVVEFRGDEALAVFDSPRAAIRAAVRLQAAYVADGDYPIPVGVGLDVGEAVPVEHGFRGAALNLAARLCGLAAAGEILASHEVVHLAGPVDGIEYIDQGEATVKNVPRRVGVTRVVAADDDPMSRFRGGDDPLRPVRVVLADDSVLFREGVARVLTDAGLVVAAQADDADSLLPLVDRERPDVVITDIRMPPTHTTEGLTAATTIRAAHPEIGVLVLSQYVETRHAIKLLQETPERVGYLLKDRVSDIGDFVDTVQRIARGGSAIDPEVIAHLLRRGERSGYEQLSDREREILGLMAEGRSNQAVCEQLFLSPKTVETHVGSIFSKLGLLPAADDHRRVLAVLTYLRESSERG
jgi:DNA-binding NarL/FixJ family response regulator/class 3 adenylate cyclase